MKFGGIGVVITKGRVTLPKGIRERGKFKAGSEINFFYTKDIIIIKKKK